MSNTQDPSEKLEIVLIKPAVAMHLKSLTVENFLLNANADEASLEQNSHIYDLIAESGSDVDLHRAYKAETGMELMLRPFYQGVPSARLSKLLKEHYSNLEQRFLHLMRLQLQDTYTTLD